MKLVRFPEAKQDLPEIRRCIRDELHNPDAAARLVRKLTDDIAQQKSNPSLGERMEREPESKGTRGF